MQVEITVGDPRVYTAMDGVVIYPAPARRLAESVCAENTREYYANKDTEISVAASPDF